MLYIASQSASPSLLWFAGLPDVLLIGLCCVAACIGALPVARALGLVKVLGSRETDLRSQLDTLAAICASMAERTDPAASADLTRLRGSFRKLLAGLFKVIQHRGTPAENFASASRFTGEWLLDQSLSRAIPLWVCRSGPAIAFGSALGALILMAEVWSNPGALGTPVALLLGLAIVVCTISMTVLAACANWLEEAQRADELAAGVAVEAARMISGGGSRSDVADRAKLILRPRTVSVHPIEVRKAA